MAAGHQESVRTDDGAFAWLGGAVNRDVFADDRAVADVRARIRGGVEGKILRIAANNGEVVDAHASTEFSPRLNNCMGRDAAAGSERRARFDDRKRTDLDVGGKSGGRVDLGGRVNHFGGLALPNSSSWAALTIS
jgi:hypothetical protein